MRRPRVRLPDSIELDTTPVMSLVVHLIPMLLLAVRFQTLTQHSAPSPLLASERSPSRREVEADDELRPTIRISARGFVVSGAGLPGSTLACQGECAYPTYDWDGLGRLMELAKGNRPEETAVVVIPDPDTPYDVVVKVFDTAGRRGGRALFPQPLVVTGAGAPP